MAPLSLTYVSDGKGKIAAVHGDRVIATGDDFAKVVAQVSNDEYLKAVKDEQEKKAAEETRKTATHITTPNGDKGTILGRTSSVFSDTITVRLENGQIRHYDTFVGDRLKFSKEATDIPQSPTEYFQRQLDTPIDSTRKGLVARLNMLDDVRRQASHLASQNVSDTDGRALHNIVLHADAERNEIQEALEHLETSDAEKMTPPKQAYQAVEQADLGRHNDSWLEHVAQEMVRESENQDFTKLLQEGPIEFVSSLDTAALGHAGVVRDLATDHIYGKTSGFQGEAVEGYRDEFVAATELARRRELSYRQDEAEKMATKEASVAEDTTDEALFL